jgi:putative undecaprenyl diphosphate synthase
MSVLELAYALYTRRLRSQLVGRPLQRMSSAYSELYFCEAYWPAFREVDFLRALRSYADRHRRRGA